jgi:pteridine reductase
MREHIGYDRIRCAHGCNGPFEILRSISSRTLDRASVTIGRSNYGSIIRLGGNRISFHRSTVFSLEAGRKIMERFMPVSDHSVALVTGAGAHRVGWHVAQALADRGCSLAIHYRSSAREAAETVAVLERRGVTASAFAADLRDEPAVKSLVSNALERFGKIDFLVHCAASWQPKLLETTTLADLQDALATNLVASFLIAQHVGLAMTAQPEGGSIVLFGDWACARPYPGYAAYFASKGSIETLVRTFAVELARKNPHVRVNGVNPGPVMLPENLPADEREEAIEGTLVKREGSPQNVAQAVLALLENDFLTGTCLTVDGGRTIQSS